MVRINFRLGGCFKDWTSVGCSDRGRARRPRRLRSGGQHRHQTYHLKVVGLISNESWNGSQADWTAKNAENNHGSGDNAYGQAFARNAAGVLASHFAGRVAVWEVWNEPNAWTANPSPGVYEGSTFLYPSNFAWLLKRSYTAIKAAEPGSSSIVVSGGLFGHDPGGASVAVTSPAGTSRTMTKHGTAAGLAAHTGATAPVTCTSSVPSGADYLCDVYSMGQQKAGWRAGAYPLDVIGQHLYVDQGGITSSSKITAYLQDVRNAYVAYEGAKTPKTTEVTEFGWVANPSSLTYGTDAANQAQNVQIAYTTFRATAYLTRADYFAAQDIPEGMIFYGLVQGDGVTYKPAFGRYQSTAAY